MWKAFQTIQTILKISDFAAKVGNLETGISDLRGQIADLKASLAHTIHRVNRLEDKAQEVQRNIKEKEPPPPGAGKKIVYHDNLLWVDDQPNPYCPTCWGKDSKLIPLQTIDVTIATASRRVDSTTQNLYCPVCRYQTGVPAQGRGEAARFF